MSLQDERRYILRAARRQGLRVSYLSYDPVGRCWLLADESRAIFLKIESGKR